MSQEDLDSISITFSGSGDSNSWDFNHSVFSDSMNSSVTIDPGIYSTTVTNGTSFQYPNISLGPNSWTSSNTSGSWTIDDLNLTAPVSGKMVLAGENADIEINGRSLMGILDGIEQRLGLLKTHETMEEEWDELRAIGDQYRAKLADIENKTKMWDTLKKMPPPEIT